jgi:hypothetical protein
VRDVSHQRVSSRGETRGMEWGSHTHETGNGERETGKGKQRTEQKRKRGRGRELITHLRVRSYERLSLQLQVAVHHARART